MDPVAVEVWRGDVIESVHRAHVAVADGEGRLTAWFGDPDRMAYLRSAAKPFQAIPLVESGAADRFRLSARELALATGSHGGEPAHVEVAASLLKKLNLSEAALQCGRHAPYDVASAERVGTAYTPLHHNCSGKHAGMLALALHLGQDPATYLEPRGPAQTSIRAAVAAECGLETAALRTGIDGCGAPNFAVPLRAAARAFARLGTPRSDTRGSTLTRIRDAMRAHPDLVAGTRRLDTDLMRASHGRLVAKAGAEACYGVGAVDAGLGIAVKIEDGAARAVGPVLVSALTELGWLEPLEAKAVGAHWSEPLRNVAGRDVGRLASKVRLQRDPSTLSTQRGPSVVHKPAPRRSG